MKEIQISMHSIYF